MNIKKILIILLLLPCCIVGAKSFTLYDTVAEQVQISDYRGYKYQPEQLWLLWNGKDAFSDRANKQYLAPKWFAEQLPTHKLSGIISSNSLNRSSLLRVLRQPLAEEGWKKLQFTVVDMTKSSDIFKVRQLQLQKLWQQNQSPYWRLQKWYSWRDNLTLQKQLDKQYQKSEHGFIIYHNALPANQTNATLWAAPYNIGIAEVVTINPGRGNFLGMMGSLDVIDDVGNIFTVGTGFSIKERRNPPPVAANLLYRFRNFTSTGKPKVPVFIRVMPNQINVIESGFSSVLTIIFLSAILFLVSIDGFSYYRGKRHLDFKSITVSVGLLGTFLGIWWGLYQFDSANVLEGVPQLLEGLKFSFITSIAAIALTSILAIVQTIRPRGSK